MKEWKLKVRILSLNKTMTGAFSWFRNCLLINIVINIILIISCKQPFYKLLQGPLVQIKNLFQWKNR